jgi:hypothetical protein
MQSPTSPPSWPLRTNVTGARGASKSLLKKLRKPSMENLLKGARRALMLREETHSNPDQ